MARKLSVVMPSRAIGSLERSSESSEAQNAGIEVYLETVVAEEKENRLRACFKIAWGPAARDFGCGQGGEAGASPQPAVRKKIEQEQTEETETEGIPPFSPFSHVEIRRCASPSGLFPENRTPRNFKTGSKPLTALRGRVAREMSRDERFLQANAPACQK